MHVVPPSYLNPNLMHVVPPYIWTQFDACGSPLLFDPNLMHVSPLTIWNLKIWLHVGPHLYHFVPKCGPTPWVRPLLFWPQIWCLGFWPPYHLTQILMPCSPPPYPFDRGFDAWWSPTLQPFWPIFDALWSPLTIWTIFDACGPALTIWPKFDAMWSPLTIWPHNLMPVVPPYYLITNLMHVVPPSLPFDPNVTPVVTPLTIWPNLIAWGPPLWSHNEGYIIALNEGYI